MTVYLGLLLPIAFPIRVRLFETGWLLLVSRALVVAFISWFAVGAVTAGPLNDAARDGDAGKVAELLAQGENVNDRDESRQTLDASSRSRGVCHRALNRVEGVRTRQSQPARMRASTFSEMTV